MTSTAHRPELEELLALHALGMLDGEDRARLEEHLAGGCPVCERQLAERLGEVHALLDSVEPVEPSSALRLAVLGQLDRETASGDDTAAVEVPVSPESDSAAAAAPLPFRRPSPPARAAKPHSSALAWAAGLAAAVLGGLLVWSILVQNDLRDEVRRAETQASELEARLQAARSELQGTRERLALASSALSAVAGGPDVALAGLGSAPGARARVFLASGGRRAVLVADALPELPAGRVYQLWAIAGGTPVPAGTFEPRSGGGTVLVEDPPEGTVVWAVTVEPTGGVPAPTGEMVLKS